MGPLPAPHTCRVLLVAKVVLVLWPGEPTALAVGLARRTTTRFTAVFLAPVIAGIGLE
jgi:hypothetical protein